MRNRSGSKPAASFFRSDKWIVELWYLMLQNIAKRWTRPVQAWKAALKQCVILFGERVPV
jgi:transposase-like protein